MFNDSIAFHRDVFSVWHTRFPDCSFCVVCDEEVELTQNKLLDDSDQLCKQEMQRIIVVVFSLVTPSPRV